MEMETVSTIAYYIFTALYVYTAIVVISVILLENRNPVKTLSWIMIMVMLPIVGIIVYILVGQDFRRKKIMTGKILPEKRSTSHILSLDHMDDVGIPRHIQKTIRLLDTNCDARLYPGNKINVYTKGYDTFKAIFRDLRNAKEHIHVEFFIIDNDDVGSRFFDILKKKAQQGVRVRVIYDYFGGWRIPRRVIKDLRSAGVYIEPFLPMDSLAGFSKVNYRNHRKLIVIDGKIGYTGGLNVAERYRKGTRLGLWRDTFMRTLGPAVHAMQYSFLNDWAFVGQKKIPDDKYFPAPLCYDNNCIQLVTSGPDAVWQNIMQGIIMAMSNAHDYIYIHTPYYLPPDSVTNALETAAMSGVDVRIIMPERNDSRLVAAASRSYIQGLLNARVRVYFYRNNFLHSKAIVIDDNISIIGSANMDIRSYEQDFEISAFVYDTETAVHLRSSFEEDLLSCRELNANVWKSRRRWQRMKESIARLFSPLL